MISEGYRAIALLNLYVGTWFLVLMANTLSCGISGYGLLRKPAPAAAAAAPFDPGFTTV